MLELTNNLKSSSLENENSIEDELFVGINPPKVKSLMKEGDSFELAMAVAIMGAGRVSPNPLVGCVCTTDRNRFLSSGAHLSFGQAHAEVNAIKSIREPVRGSHVVVTLEPCSHTGKTPPCSELLIKSGVGRVYVGLMDPNPEVSGRGIEALRSAGIEVMPWPREFAERLIYLAEVFLKSQLSDDIFIGLKAATDSQGLIANRGDKRAFITHERSRKYGHYLWQRYDAIAVGADTLIMDNPKLTAYLLENSRRPNVVVFDGEAKALKHFAKMTPNIIQNMDHKVFWVVEESENKPETFRKPIDNLKRQGVEFIFINNPSEGSQWIEKVNKVLFDHGCRSLLLEGGAGLWRSFLKAEKVDRLHWFQGLKKVDLSDPIIFNELFELEKFGFKKQYQTTLIHDEDQNYYSEWASEKTFGLLSKSLFDGSVSNRQFY